MDKRPGFRKRIALELFRSIRKNRAKLHELRTLFWECTLRCNASCRHCGSDCHVSAGMKDMPMGDFLKVVDDITPYVEPNKVLVIFTGGEALVRKDIEVCGMELYRRGYPWGIVSNGLLMTRERLDSLLASGLHSATISLDGFEEAHNWLRRHPKSFENAVNAICMLPEETSATPSISSAASLAILATTSLEICRLPSMLLRTSIALSSRCRVSRQN